MFDVTVADRIRRLDVGLNGRFPAGLDGAEARIRRRVEYSARARNISRGVLTVLAQPIAADANSYSQAGIHGAGQSS